MYLNDSDGRFYLLTHHHLVKAAMRLGAERGESGGAVGAPMAADDSGAGAQAGDAGAGEGAHLRR